MTVSVECDLHTLEKLAADLEKAGSHKVSIGIKDIRTPSKISTQEYSVYFEFGWTQKASVAMAKYLTAASGEEVKPGSTLMSPPRPFFRGTIDEEGDKWVKFLKNAVRHYSVEHVLAAHLMALDLVGLKVQQDIQHTLANGGTRGQKFPQRSPLTMAIYKAMTEGHKTDGSGNYSTTKPGVVLKNLLHSVAYEIS